MLPREYTRVEWIESTGSQYIDTGFKPNQDTRVVMDVQGKATSTTAVLYYGARQNNVSFWGGKGAGGNYTMYGAYNASMTTFAYTANTYNQRYIVDHNKNVFKVGNNTYAFAYAAFSVPNTLLLFGIHDTGGTKRLLCECLCFSSQIYSNGTQVRDYIPFIDASNVANLWDDINLAPATKSGTFLYGPAVIPSAPANLAHSISDGTVALTWTAADEYANHYKIVRDGIELADIDGDVFAYIDTTAEAGAAHTYKVVACNGTQGGGASSVTVQLPLLIPQILAALITPNPATINQKITITVTVSEIEKFLEPTYFYSGEIYAGEV